MQAIQDIFTNAEWLTHEQINALQATPPVSKVLLANDWKLHGRVFSTTYRGKEYFARYQFDPQYHPLPIIKETLAALGEVADTWTVAAWFHFPNGWLVRRDEGGAVNVAPKDALDRGAEVVQAAAKRLASCVAWRVSRRCPAAEGFIVRSVTEGS